MATRLKWATSIIVAVYGWVMVGMTIFTMADMNTCPYSIDVLHLVDHCGIAFFGSIYVGFLCCKTDLLDSVANPLWHSIYIFMIYLLIPCSFLDVVFVLILQLKCSGLPVRALVFAWGSAVISISYSMAIIFYIFVQKMKAVIKAKKLREKESRYKLTKQRLQQELAEDLYNKVTFVNLYEEKQESVEPMDKHELTFLNRFYSVSALLDSTIVTLQECCPICQSDFTQSASVLMLPKCRHRFDLDCVGRWFDNSILCPVCKSNVRQNMLKSFSEDIDMGLRTNHDSNQLIMACRTPIRICDSSPSPILHNKNLSASIEQ